MTDGRELSSTSANTRKGVTLSRDEKGCRCPESLRRRILTILTSLKRFLFGDDAFISYSRQDAAEYALALAGVLTSEKLSCYLDQWGTRPGKTLPDELIVSLKRSALLVLLGTPGAAQSESVSQEVALFLETGRPIIPVSFDGALEQADYYWKIAGLSVFADSQEALRNARPAGALVKRILNAEGFMSRTKRLRQIFRATAVGVAVLALAGASVAGYFAVRASAQRRASRVLKLTSESIVALKQERNPTKAYELASMAMKIDSSSVQAWGALLDARYFQTFLWQGRYYAVPFSKTYTLSGILGAADVSGDGRTLAVGSWDPFVARMWRVDGERIVSLLGFSGPIWKIHFSPNDLTLLVAATIGPARIYERNGALRCRLQILEQELTSAEFSGDGEWIVTGFADGTAAIWDARTGEQNVRLAGKHRARVTSASFSPAGDRVLTTHADGTTVVWDERGSNLVELHAGPGSMNSARFSPDGLRIATASQNGEARIWHLNGRKIAPIAQCSSSLPISPDPMLGVTWSPDGSRLVTYSEKGMLTQSRKDGVILWTTKVHDSRVRGAQYSSGGRHIVTYADDNTIKLWTADGQLLLTLGEFTGPVLVAGISRDETLVYGSGWDNTAKVYPLNQHPLTTYFGQTGISKVEITPDGSKVISASTAGRAVLWQRDGTPIKTIEPGVGWLTGMVLSPDGYMAFIQADSGGVLWDLQSLQWRQIQIESAVTGARFLPDGKQLLTGSADCRLRIWTRKGDPTAIFGFCANSIRDLDISSDGTRAAVATDSGGVEVWSLPDMRRRWHRAYHNNEPVNSIRFSGKGDLIVSAGSKDHRAIVYDAEGNLLHVLRHSNDVLSAAFSEDDELILTNSSDGSARLWSHDGDLRAELRTPSSVNRAVFSKDTRFIATASNDGKVRIWDSAGILLTTLPAGDRGVSWIALSDKGDWLVSIYSDGIAFGWNLRSQSEVSSKAAKK